MKFTFFIAILFLFAVFEANGQPGCGGIFHPSVTCSWHYYEKEFIFVGRVVSRDEDQEWITGPQRIVVAVEKRIEGVVESQIYLYLDRTCSDTVQKGGRHIFTARSVSDHDFTGLLSKEWSLELGAYSPEEIDEIVEKIQNAQRNIKQPPITGKVIQSLVSGFDWSMTGSALNLKLGYDSRKAKPFHNAVVVAYDKDGKRFTTRTNKEGKYTFENVPNGLYEISLDLPAGFRILEGGDSAIIKDGRKFVEVSDDICEKRINFAVEEIKGNGLNVPNINKIHSIRPIFLEEDNLKEVNPFFSIIYSQNEQSTSGSCLLNS